MHRTKCMRLSLYFIKYNDTSDALKKNISMRKLDCNAHSVFLLYYHLILVVKYRKKVLNDPISNRAKEIFEHIAPNYHITLE